MRARAALDCAIRWAHVYTAHTHTHSEFLRLRRASSQGRLVICFFAKKQKIKYTIQRTCCIGVYVCIEPVAGRIRYAIYANEGTFNEAYEFNADAQKCFVKAAPSVTCSDEETFPVLYTRNIMRLYTRSRHVRIQTRRLFRPPREREREPN